MDILDLKLGDAILDLGCGPGLYANRFAQLGVRVTGVDYSRRSIDYARSSARELGLEISYRCQDYLTLEDDGLYMAALLISGEYCVFDPQQRRQLLANVGRALKPGGFFVFDVSTPNLLPHQEEHTEWQALATGLWRPGPYLVLTQGLAYPDQGIYLDQYIIIEADGRLSVYRNWFQDFEREGITAELEAGGFEVLSVWGDLAGKPCTPEGEWIGLVAQKRIN